MTEYEYDEYSSSEQEGAVYSYLLCSSYIYTELITAVRYLLFVMYLVLDSASSSVPLNVTCILTSSYSSMYVVHLSVYS